MVSNVKDKLSLTVTLAYVRRIRITRLTGANRKAIRLWIAACKSFPYLSRYHRTLYRPIFFDAFVACAGIRSGHMRE